MTTVLHVGVAVVDFLLTVETFPQAPEKYRARDGLVTGGGNAANAAAAVARLGGSALLAARTGDDMIADLVLSSLTQDGVSAQHVRRFAGCRGSFSSVLVDAEGERQIVNFRDPGLPTNADWISDLPMVGVGAVLTDTRWPEGALAAMELAAKAGVPGVIDGEQPIEGCGDALRAASHCAFSEQGLRDFTNGDLAAAQNLCGGFVAVTKGAEGTFWADGSGETSTNGHVPSVEVQAIETLGAGDVWHGAFTLALARGDHEAQAMTYANRAASLKCTRSGGRASYPTAAELKNWKPEADRHG
ncbi:MAG: PfkB family carbohydrate kinase [Pseudomonadota bacterium]